MVDPFASYTKAMDAFVQGGKTDFAALYEATDKLRRLNFSEAESTPLMNFYSDVAERYRQKVETAKVNKASLQKAVDVKYAKEEQAFLNLAKEQWKRQQPRGGKHNNWWFENKELINNVTKATSIEEFKQLVPGFKLDEMSIYGDKRDRKQTLKFFTTTGERKTAKEIYDRTLDEDFGRYAASETDISVFGSQADSSTKQFEAQRSKLLEENERKKREFLETKQKLLTSAEEIGRAKRPSYIERPL